MHASEADSSACPITSMPSCAAVPNVRQVVFDGLSSQSGPPPSHLGNFAKTVHLVTLSTASHRRTIKRARFARLFPQALALQPLSSSDSELASLTRLLTSGPASSSPSCSTSSSSRPCSGLTTLYITLLSAVADNINQTKLSSLPRVLSSTHHGTM